MSKKETSKELDQFYTNVEIAKECWATMINHLPSIHLNIEDAFFIEPSAGNGRFWNLMPKGSIGIDLDPKLKGIKKKDFFTFKFPKKENIVVVGNPPFGKTGKLALNFLNKSLDSSDMVAFIVPLQFEKWSIQSKIKEDAILICSKLLPSNSFRFNNKPHIIRCVFQIWTMKETSLPDLRMKVKPAIAHPDFKMWQYNNTESAKKVFLNAWDFAVPRQGYQDYSRREVDVSKCELNKQWILFKAKNNKVLQNLKNIDFDQLSKKNTLTPGFGKADLIQEYVSKYGC